MPHRLTSLPEPTVEEQAQSLALREVLQDAVRAAGGCLPFSQFMELALYRPGLGYYASGRLPFGAGGDFVTASELGSVFARCLARQCAQILSSLKPMHTGPAEILEAGAGSGVLAAELLLELERLGSLPNHYRILELSNALRARQSETLQTRAPHLMSRIEWLDRLPASGIRGIVFGNELLDALPVERFRVHAGGVVRLGVGLDGNEFVWRELPAEADIRQRLAALALPPGYESEIGFAAEGWVRSLAEKLEAGAMLLIDYGFPRAEFYHEDRSGGTLMCHYRHHAHPDPFRWVGLQDITAHIDFSAMAAAGREAGLDVCGYTSQAMFLLGCGLEEVAAEALQQDARTTLTVTNEIKKLTLPQEMGELFKVLALGRGIDIPLRGFAIQDRRARL